jgi:hypothetical protein
MPDDGDPESALSTNVALEGLSNRTANIARRRIPFPFGYQRNYANPSYDQTIVTNAPVESNIFAAPLSVYLGGQTLSPSGLSIRFNLSFHVRINDNSYGNFETFPVWIEARNQAGDPVTAAIANYLSLQYHEVTKTWQHVSMSAHVTSLGLPLVGVTSLNLRAKCQYYNIGAPAQVLVRNISFSGEVYSTGI